MARRFAELEAAFLAFLSLPDVLLLRLTEGENDELTVFIKMV